MGIDDLSDEKSIILMYLNPRDITNIKKTNKEFYNLLNFLKKKYTENYIKSKGYTLKYFYNSLSLKKNNSCISFHSDVYLPNKWENIVFHLSKF